MTERARRGGDGAGGGADERAKALMSTLLDELDEERARRLREELGRRRRVVSWSTTPGGPWLARVSGPGHPETIERVGLTRVHAIELAAEALESLLARP